MNRYMLKSATLAGVGLAMCIAVGVSAGDLNPPPGPIGPTGRFGPRTEIDQLPCTIDGSGSYYFGKNLTGTVGENGITIIAEGVTIDLNGFALIGVAGSGDGIVVSGTRNNISIFNGTVRGWGGDGLNLPDVKSTQVKNLRVSDNGGNGITALGNGIAITECMVQSNGEDGINVNVLGGNEIGGKIESCTATDNASDGIEVGRNWHVLGNVCGQNVGNGIYVTEGGNRIEANFVNNNGNGAVGGIVVVGDSNLVIRNTCAGNPTNYDIAAGSAAGEILNYYSGGTVTECNPWANFEF